MKYKNLWMPIAFSAISFALLFCLIYIPIAVWGTGDWGDIGFMFIGLCIWFFLVPTVMPFIYARKVLAEDDKWNFLYTLYNAFVMVLPFIWPMIDAGVFFACPALFLWSEMWSLLGMAKKGSAKKYAVWYAPAFIFVAVSVSYLVIDIVLMGIASFDQTAVLVPIIGYLAVPVALFIYARACVKGRKNRVFYTVYAALLMTASAYVTLLAGRTIHLDGAKNILIFALNLILYLVLYELAALLGAGYKIKLPKRKKKAEGETKAEEIEDSKED